MKRKILTFSVIVLLSSPVYSQMGINNNDPKVTLDVTAKNIDGTSPEGIRAPMLTGDVLHDADTGGMYSTDQDGAIVFVTAAASVANQVGQTVDVKEIGYYYYDVVANKWIRFSTSVGAGPGTIVTLNCGAAVNNGVAVVGVSAAGVTSVVPYTGGNGGPYAGQSISSTGVTGLTATITGGSFATGNGNLTYTITGTPSALGTANFALNIGGANCTLAIVVRPMGAFTAPGVYTEFARHNLGATTSLDPMTPAAGIHGAKYQWGAQTGQAGRYIDQATDQSNSGVIVGWNVTALPDNTWQDATKTANDPCPVGFRVPTQANWQGVIANNVVSRVGTWTNSPTNFSSAVYLGQNASNKTMMLPADGERLSTGSLNSRGAAGFYWSSTQTTLLTSLFLVFNATSMTANPGGSGAARIQGAAIRCISQ